MKIIKVLPIFIALLFLLSSCQFLFSYLTASYKKDSSSNSADTSQPSSTNYENEVDKLSFLDVDSTKEESIQADQLFEVLIKENKSVSSSFSSIGFDVTEEDALIYAESAALIGDKVNLYKMLEYLGYQIDNDELKKAENYSYAKVLILEGSYSEAYQLLSKDIDYIDSKKLREEMVEKNLINFEIGDIGPAGGIVFYDKGAYSDGWRFLEAAPADIGEYEWGKYGVIGTSKEIGAGKTNTEKIVKKFGQGEYAAKACSDYEFNGYDDWFLPSEEELNLLHENLYKKDICNLKESSYWSSSVYSNGYDVWLQDFIDGNQYNDFPYYSYYVRPIRAF